MREEFGGGASLSVLSLRLVPWRKSTLRMRFIWFSTSDSSKHLVYIVLQVHNSFDCFIPALEGVKY